MFQMMILVCALGVPRAQCQADTALDVLHGPQVVNELMCGLHGQAMMAGTSLIGRNKGEYIKLTCARAKQVGNAVKRQDTAEAIGRRLQARRALAE